MRTSNARTILAISAAILISTGCSFSKLDKDLARLDAAAQTYSGTVTSDNPETSAIVVVAFQGPGGGDIGGFDIVSGGGPFEIRLDPEPTYLFAFSDLNKDLRFQRDEPFGWAANGLPLALDTDAVTRSTIEISISASYELPVPAMLVDEPLSGHIDNALTFSIGTVSSLDSPLFSDEQVKKGLWQPFAFMEDGGAGIHFLEPYDPERIPVLFVHGINGSPQNFATLIEQLDRSKYQVWAYSYPSGLKLSWLASGMAKFLEILHTRLDFDELHVVAHSMGGLVSRGGVNLCAQGNACAYLRTYTSISTPWNGVQSAQSGVKWAPSVVPVWRDLDPTSEYVTTLFDTPLPAQLPYHLLFGFRQHSIFGSESSDGVIKLTSQLRQAAQDQAVLVHGYDEDHVSILSNPMVLEQVYNILDTANE